MFDQGEVALYLVYGLIGRSETVRNPPGKKQRQGIFIKTCRVLRAGQNREHT